MSVLTPFQRLRVWVARALIPAAVYGLRVHWPRRVHEPHTGAWQRNLSDASDLSLLSFSPVYSCINVISSDIGKLPVNLYRWTDDFRRELHMAHPYFKLLNYPNHYQTRLAFYQQWIVSKLIAGNTYVLKRRDERGVVNALYILDPTRVVVLVAEDGSVFYQLFRDVQSGRLSGLTGESVVVPASEIIHDRCMTLWHPLVGVTPIFAAAMSADAGLNILRQSNTFFSNMARPSGILTSPQRISPELALRLQTEWEGNFTAGKVGRVAVLGEDLKWQSMTMNAVDAQLIEQLKWSVEDVARVFRVPPFMLGDLSHASYRNNEQMFRTYYNGCLAYHIEGVELCLDKGLELPNRVEVEFDLEQLFRMEADIRFTVYDKAIKAGIYSINEVRLKENLPPTPGGEAPMIQMQYVPLPVAVEQAKVNLEKSQEPPPPALPAPAAEEPEPEEKPPEEAAAEAERAVLVSSIAEGLVARLQARRAQWREDLDAAA